MTKIILSVLAFISSLVNPVPNNIKPEIKPAPTEITQKIDTYEYRYFLVSDNNQLKLQGNWSEKKSLKQLAEENHCGEAINAGFYDTEGKPLGLFINPEFQKPAPKTSNLINGYLYYDDKNIDISGILPEQVKWAVQTGPLLNDSLQIANDKPARRTVAIKTDKTMVFLIIYNENSRLDGPWLKNLYSEVKKIANKEGWKVKSAINLDGGSASAFVDEKIYIPELTFVGSFFCNKRLI